MNYKEIKTEIQENLEELNSARLNLSNTNDELKNKKLLLTNLTGEKSKKIESEKSRKLEEFEKSIVEPYNKSIAKLENNRVNLKNKRDDILGRINSDNYKLKDKYKNKYNLKEEFDTCNELNNILETYYGPEFNRVLDLVVEGDDQVDNLSEVIKNVKLLKGSKNSNFDLAEFMDGLMEKLSLNGNPGEGEINEQIPIALGIGIAFILMVVFLYPGVILLAAVPLIYNLAKSHYYIRAKGYCKTLLERKSEIEVMMNEEIDRAVMKDREKLNNQFEEINKKISKRIKHLEDESELELEQQKLNFVFSTVDIDNEFLARETNIKAKISGLEENLNKLNSQVQSYSNKLTELRGKLGMSLVNIVTDYLGGKEEDYSDDLPKDYLFNVSNDEPVFFELPSDSAIFFYSSKEELDGFIDLIYYQTIGRIKPTNVRFYYLDNKYLGDRYMTEKDLSCIQIGDSDNQDEIITSIETELRRRMPIMSHYNSIVDYNEFMRSQDCLGESYYLILNLYPDLSSILTESMKSICNIGNKYGIYNYIFIDNKEFNSDNAGNLETLCNSVSKYYSITSRGVKKRCKEFVMARIEDLS